LIPSEIIAKNLLFEVYFTDWRFEWMSTNWCGYWIAQLKNDRGEALAFLLHLDNLAAICRGLRACIDTALNPASYPRATTMFQTVAINLPTTKSNDGGIAIVSEWQTEPLVMFFFYPDRKVEQHSSRIIQGLAVEDAQDLYNFFARVYNEFPEKHTWVPQKPTVIESSTTDSVCAAPSRALDSRPRK
jgi:hypothetical protein